MFKFKVTPPKGEAYEVKAISPDVIAWEMTDRQNSLMKLQEELRMTDLTAIAFSACQRLGLYQGNLKEFQTTCAIEMLEDEETDPFQQAA